MPETDTELTALVSKLLDMQAKLAELETQQAGIKQQLAATLAQADGMRRKRKKEKGTDPRDTVQE